MFDYYVEIMFINKITIKMNNQFFLNICYVLLLCAVLNGCFCTGHCVMRPLNMTSSILIAIFYRFYLIFYNFFTKRDNNQSSAISDRRWVCRCKENHVKLLSLSSKVLLFTYILIPLSTAMAAVKCRHI